MFKCHDLIYCFEIDGTLVDNIPYKTHNYIKRNIKLLNSKSIFNPSKYDIRWSIVTNHPAVDYIFIRTACFVNGMIPSQIVSLNKFKVLENIEECASKKAEFFKMVLDGKKHFKYAKGNIRKIINVSNNQFENQLINSVRNGYEFISVNVIDFKREFFNKIV